MKPEEIEKIQFLCKKCGKIAYIVIDDSDSDIRNSFKKIETAHAIANPTCQYEFDKILIINPFSETN